LGFAWRRRLARRTRRSILLVFLIGSFPISLLAVNFCALYVIVKYRSEPSLKRRVCLWIAVSILWIIVAAYDHHRSFREIAPLTASMPVVDLLA